MTKLAPITWTSVHESLETMAYNVPIAIVDVMANTNPIYLELQ